MRWAIAGLVLGSCLAGLCPPAVAGGESVLVQHETIRARGLSGFVEDAAGNAVAGAQLDLFMCPHSFPHGAMDGRVMRSTRTDSEGRFNFEDVSGSQLRCVRITRRGFQPLVVRVKITLLAMNMKLTLLRPE